jgi:hypothetical protein
MSKIRDAVEAYRTSPNGDPVINATSGVKLPVGSTAERPAGESGVIRINTDYTTSQVLEFYNGERWKQIDVFVPITASGGATTTTTIEGIQYKIHVFTADSTFEITDGGTETRVDILVVGGGGSGSTTMSRHKGGAGGAGGLVFVPGLQLELGSYSVQVGAGGAGRPGSESSGTLLPGLPGENSTFGSIITALGGGAGVFDADPGGNAYKNGGSGGGGHYSANPGGTGLQPSQSGYSGAPYGFGNNGGTFSVEEFGYGGGGAGKAGENDVNAPNSSSQTGRWAGGTGLYQAVINGLTYNFGSVFDLASLGYGEFVNGQYYFAGGGAAGSAADGVDTYGDGGWGGGGRGAYQQAGADTGVWGVGSAHGEDGIPNTGGGGGSARGGSSGAGGSGIVIIRYPLEA